MLSIRYILASAVIWAIIIFTKQPVAVSLADLKQLAILSLLGYGIATTLFFQAIQLLSASLASMILYTYPVMVALTEHLIYKQKMSWPKLLALLVSTVGLFLILGTTFTGLNTTGLLCGLGTAAAYSSYLLYANKAAKDRSPLVSTGFMLTFAAIGFTLFALFNGLLNCHFESAVWWSIVALAVISTSMPVLILLIGLQWVAASRAAIISTIEPVFTVLCAAALFSETVQPPQIAGGLMVLLAIFVLQLDKKEKEFEQPTQVAGLDVDHKYKV
jgi:drug/metabolite transporter (DMT)-like permease